MFTRKVTTYPPSLHSKPERSDGAVAYGSPLIGGGLPPGRSVRRLSSGRECSETDEERIKMGRGEIRKAAQVAGKRGEPVPRILDGIASPKDLKGLDIQALTQLAKEIREEIVATVSVTGGHLGASLGVVELTLALHSVLDAPRDKIIWDVGHQAYPHKLVTGRKDRFRTLRQAGGISGFPRIAESEYDAFGVGHAGTSISAALGYAIARDRKGEEAAVVAVIGDGALTAGMAFEALNHAGDMGIDLVVIINDNEMSIAPNVGAYRPT